MGLSRAQLIGEARSAGPASSLEEVEWVLRRGEDALMAPLPPSSPSSARGADAAAVAVDGWRAVFEAHARRLRRLRWHMRAALALAPGSKGSLQELEGLLAEAGACEEAGGEAAQG
jgi:hypothetical protein